MSDIHSKVNCRSHGDSYATYLCQHLADSTGVGFFHADHTDQDPYPDAWCVECEEALQRYGEWNEKALETASFRLICAGCYPKAKKYANRYQIH